ncbi:hypothetical protein [Alkaliphilus transvaalensis]|uniref:hypothetical protein n=1 Tax=Alkaliphilus transvaalensis TaxID=114628 RepID=UPI00047BB637|nr:hypothetical protein [Alkaliphilus transvaalensis]
MIKKESRRGQTKRGRSLRDMNENFFNAMNYELAGEIGAIDNEDMLNNRKLLTGKNQNRSRSRKDNARR